MLKLVEVWMVMFIATMVDVTISESLVGFDCFLFAHYFSKNFKCRLCLSESLNEFEIGVINHWCCSWCF